MISSDIVDVSLNHWNNVNALGTQVQNLKNVHVHGALQLNDSNKLIFGDAGSGDSYILFDGSDLTFFDSTVGATKTLTQLAAAGSTTLDGAFDNGKIIDGATSEANAMQVGGSNDKITFWEEGSNDLRISTTAAANLALEAAGGYINILSDTTKLGFGAAGGATDAYIYFDGTSLTFYDSQVGLEYTLQSLIGGALNNPVITGTVTQTHTGTTQAYSLTADSITTNDVMQINAAGLTTGTALRIDLTEGTLNGGFYFEAWDDTAGSAVATIGEDGATVLAGSAAGTDVLTLTAGDLTLSSGDISVAIGTITVADTADSANKISRNNATGTDPVLEVEQTHATGGVGLLVDQNATGDVNAVEITNAGTGFAVTTTAAAAAGEGFEYIAAASGTGIGISLDGATGSWIGANGVGLINAVSDGALVAGTSICRLESQTQPNAAIDGAVLNVIESGAAQATTYAVHISSTNNEALHVDAGLSLFDERVTITLADNTGPALAITNPDTTGDTDAVTVTPSGAGAGILITPQETDTQGLKIVAGAASTTVAMLEIDGATADWIGGAATGMATLTSDGAIVADGTLLRLASSGQPAAANDGVCLEIVESGAAQATSYAMRITSTNNEALHVDAGMSLFDEGLTVADGGVVKVGGTAAHAGTAGDNILSIFNGTAPVGALANGASFYSAAGEMTVIDSGGNTTTLSPHTPDGDFIINSYSAGKGKTLRVHFEKMVNAMIAADPSLRQFVEYLDGAEMSPLNG